MNNNDNYVWQHVPPPNFNIRTWIQQWNTFLVALKGNNQGVLFNSMIFCTVRGTGTPTGLNVETTGGTIGITESFLFNLKLHWIRKDIPQDIGFVKASIIISVLKKNLFLWRTGRRKPWYNIIYGQQFWFLYKAKIPATLENKIYILSDIIKMCAPLLLSRGHEKGEYENKFHWWYCKYVWPKTIS